jgi:thioredoxin reductase (NADPH)
MFDRARSNPRIDWITNAVVDEVLGENGKLSAVRVQNVNTGEKTELPTDGLFVAIGHDPNTQLFLDELDHDEAGYLEVQPGSTATNIKGVFAAGDVADHTYRQAVTAAGTGAMAALDAERLLSSEEHQAEPFLTPHAEAV